MHPTFRPPLGAPWLLAIALSAACCADIIHVDDSAPPQGDGSSWNTAFRSVAKALNSSQPGDEIRIAQGTYRPTKPNGKRQKTFSIGDALLVQGGYAGFGASDPDELNPSQFKTTLSGDLNSNDGSNFANNGENSYHVVTMKNAQLRGVMIQDGNANHPNLASPHRNGAGVRCLESGNPLLVECVIRRNHASGLGAGLHGGDTLPTLMGCIIRNNHISSISNNGAGVWVNFGNFENCTFRKNTVSQSASYGGGLRGNQVFVSNCTFLHNNASAVSCADNSTIQSSTFFSNGGEDGAGIMISGLNVAVIDCTFDSNNVASHGGAIFLGSDSSASLINCEFFNNSANGLGHALIARSDLLAVNCLFSGNTGSNDSLAAIECTDGEAEFINCTITGTQVFFTGDAAGIRGNGSTVVRNCILWNNATGDPTPDEFSQVSGALMIENSCIQHWSGGAGEGNFGDDPQFIDPDGADDVLGTPDDDLRLAGGSSCLDAGSNAALPSDEFDLDEDGDTSEPIPLDLDFEERINGPAVDLGPYEF